MNSLKLQNEKVSAAIARLEILVAVVNNISMMDCSNAKVHSGTSSRSESLEVQEEEKSSPRQYASGKIKDSDVIGGFRNSFTGKDNDRDEPNTVDTDLEELSTT